MRVTILPSPLLPATAYELLAEGLRGAGTEASVADPALSASQTAGDLITRWAGDALGSDVVVAHSNAGYLAPLVRERGGGGVPVVFMDAALPPGSGRTRLAPPELRAHLRSLADRNGLLPPWTRWWAREALAEVVPDELFGEIDRKCPRLPERYFDHRLEAPGGWFAEANAYLAFGKTYAAELGFARSHRWPTRLVEAGHLHFLHQPQVVAALLLELASEIRDVGR